MTFTLYVDTARWRAHQERMRVELPRLVPVVKGNGYGVGNARLAAEAARLGVDTVAVGRLEEVPAVREHFPGDVLVMTPWRPGDPRVGDERTIRTVSNLAALDALRGTGARVVVEVLTSMRRHGIPPPELPQVVRRLGGVRCEGVALHLPLVGDGRAEAAALLTALPGGAVPGGTVWVSHLDVAQVRSLAAELPGVDVRLRTGTRLWLGDRGALEARGTVVDRRDLGPGESFGYRQRRVRRPARLLVVSGGTANGVALEAPKPLGGTLARAKVLAAGGLAAAGRARSPFAWHGRPLWFAEPPHMQVSLLLTHRRHRSPAAGDELPCEVRLTTTHPDRVVDI